jgi:hypothetical protein
MGLRARQKKKASVRQWDTLTEAQRFERDVAKLVEWARYTETQSEPPIISTPSVYWKKPVREALYVVRAAEEVEVYDVLECVA